MQAMIHASDYRRYNFTCHQNEIYNAHYNSYYYAKDFVHTHVKKPPPFLSKGRQKHNNTTL